MNDVINKYPISKTHFFKYMLNTYNVSETKSPCFYDAPEYEQHRAIARYFGYPIMHQEYTSEEILLKETEKYLREYNEIMVKYSENVPDPLQEMNNMSFSERVLKYSDMFNKSSNLIYGLCHSLVPIDKNYSLKMPVMKSLKDSLVEIKSKTILPDEPTVCEEINIKKEEEDAPF